MKRQLIILASSSLHSQQLQEGLDLALVLAVMDQAPAVALIDTAVHLLSLPAEVAQGRRHLGKLLASLPLYGISELFVQAPIVSPPWRVIDSEGLTALVQSYEEVSLW